MITGQDGPEIINSVTGKDDRGKASRLSKRALFSRFLNLISSITNLNYSLFPRQYSDTKCAVQDYRVCK